jgi:hypothetical protein
LTLLQKRVSRQIGEKVGYDALRFLAEAGLSGAAETLGTILSEIPLDAVPAAVGMDLMNLINGKPQLAPALDSAAKRIGSSTAPVGLALAAAKPVKKG